MDLIARALGWATLNALWQGCVIGAGVWLFVRQADTAAARYRATFVGLGTAALLFVLSALLYLRPPALLPPETLIVPTVRSLLQREGVTPDDVLRWIGFGWLGGAILVAVRYAGGWLWARQLYIRQALPAPLVQQRFVQRVARKYSLPTPRVLASALIDSPAVVGVVRPVLVLPVRGLETLDQNQLDAIIAHELAHIERHDAVASVAQAVVDALLFFHPVVRLLSRTAHAEREHICDVRAVDVCGSAPRYIRALLTLEEARRYSAPPVLAARAGTLVTRVRHLVRPRKRSALPSPVLRACSLACTALAMTGAFVLQPALQKAVAILSETVQYTVSASDPAGDFTISIERGVAVGATLARSPVPTHRIRQAGDSVFILNDAGARELALRVATTGGISWSPRPPKTL